MKRDNDAFALSRRYRQAPLVIADRDAVGEGDWSYELAWDGHRVMVVRVDDRVRIVSADLREWSDAFHDVAGAVRRLPSRSLVFEGFLCAIDATGRPSFELLRKQARTKPKALLVAWDLVHLDGEDQRSFPLAQRRARLETLLTNAGNTLTPSQPLGGTIDAVLTATRDQGVPGICARREDAPYPSPGDPPWLLIPHDDIDVAQFQSRSLSAPPAITNEAKTLFPRDGFTKKDIVGYYDSISDVLLPLLAERPVVCQRWPDGIDEFTWYQHRIPPRAPDYLRGVWIEGNHRILLSNKESLLWMVNQAALTLHGWSSRTGRLSEPDWVTIDLDPGEGTQWEDVLEVAIAVRKLLELLELESVPKTSGQRGFHVLVPLARGHTVAQAQECARRIALMIARLLPEKVTLEATKEKRRGRLYLDHMQSFVGKSLALAYSLRAVDGAPVSTPLAWSEVGPGLDPRSFTLRSVRARIDKLGDSAAPLLTGRAQLRPVLERLDPGV